MGAIAKYLASQNKSEQPKESAVAKYLKEKEQIAQPRVVAPAQVPVTPQPLKTFQPVPMPRPEQQKGLVDSYIEGAKQFGRSFLAGATDTQAPSPQGIAQKVNVGTGKALGQVANRALGVLSLTGAPVTVVNAAQDVGKAEEAAYDELLRKRPDLLAKVGGPINPENYNRQITPLGKTAKQIAGRQILSDPILSAAISPQIKQQGSYGNAAKQPIKASKEMVTKGAFRASPEAQRLYDPNIAVGRMAGIPEQKIQEFEQKHPIASIGTGILAGAPFEIPAAIAGRVATQAAKGAKAAKVAKGKQALADVNEAYAGAKRAQFPMQKPKLQQAEKTIPLKQPTIPKKAPSNVKTLPVKGQPKVGLNKGQSRQIPIDARTYEDVADKNVKAYQYEHPELKKYYQEEAYELMGDLDNSVKGQRFNTIDEAGNRTIVGQKKLVSPTIDRIQKATGASYDQIENALTRIINDHGQENTKLAKQIELIIDDNLTTGKRTFDGEHVPSNDEYILAKAQITSKLSQLEAKLARQVNETIEPAVAKVGMRVQKLQNEPKVGKTTTEYKFSDPEVEARWQKASEGVQKEGLFARTKEALRSLGRKATREYEDLPKTKEWAQARFDLLKMEKQKGVAGDRTLRIQQGITAKLEKPEFDLFTRKVILDDLVKEEGSLPFGFSKETLSKEKSAIDSAITSNPKLAEAVAQRKQAWEAIKGDYSQAMKSIGFDVSKKLSKEDYFRHQVLEYANAKNITGTGQKLKTPTGRGFLKTREGSSKDINTNYLQAEYEVMAQMIHDIEVAKTIKGIEKNYSIRDELVKKHGKKWSENVPEGYTVWQPRQGSGFYLADSISAKVADQLYSGIAKEIGITEDMLSKVIAKGSRFKEFVIKEELAKTLNKLSDPPSESVVGKFSSTITGAWKQWQLLSPRRFIKYNLRNISGDIDKVFAGNPRSVAKAPQATKELYQVFAGNRAMTADMKDWFERGGMQTLLQVQELGDINKLKMFADLQESKGTVKEFPVKLWQGYWKAVRISTDFREAIMRYASYLDYIGQMKKNNGKPFNYGASIPEEINGLPDIRDKAFKLSNELLGAYDSVSVLGKDIRKHVIPFWSFQETNFRSYAQMIKNASRDEKLAQFAGRKLLGTAIRSPFIAMRVGSFAIKASAMWAGLQAYNYMRFPDEERDLPKDVQARPHIVLGRDADGNVRYFDRLGTSGDFLSWFGLDTPAREVSDFLNGKRTVKEIAIDMAKSPINKLTQGIAPLIKTPFEALSGYKFFPDTFKPTKIRDMKDYFAQSFGVENEFRALTDRPSKPYGASISSLYEYKTNPDQVSYYNILDEKRRFEKSIGKLNEGFSTSPRSEALYNYKLSLRYKDQEAAEKYLGEYMLLGGKKEDMEQSLETMHPLYGLNMDDVKKFLQSLRQEERDELTKAIRYYESLVPPKLAIKSRKKYKGAPKV